MINRLSRIRAALAGQQSSGYSRPISDHFDGQRFHNAEAISHSFSDFRCWWQSVELPGRLTLTVTPAQHWSRRGLFDRNRSLWAGYWIAAPVGGVYFAGDTGLADHFEAIRDQLGAPRVALLPIGAYAPRWFMAPQHMNPADAVIAHQRLEAEQSIGIHFATFKLSDEAQFAPVDDLNTARAAAGLRLSHDEFWAPTFGAGYVFD